MKIRAVLETVSSKRDLNGNCYHFGIITSVETGESLIIQGLGGNGNGQHLLRQAGLEWNEIHSTNCDVPIREFNHATKQHDKEKKDRAKYEKPCIHFYDRTETITIIREFLNVLN